MHAGRDRILSTTHTLGVAACLAVIACGGGGGGGGGSGGGNETRITLSSLSEAERQAFEAWKLRPLKACAWYEAFPKLAEAYPPPDGGSYVPADPKADVDQFVRYIGESPADQGSRGLPILEGAGGELVLFDGPITEWSWETCNRSSTRMVNGVGTVLDVKSERNDGVCVITLGGEEIFRARLTSQLPVLLGYDPTAAVSAPAELDPLQVRTVTGDTAARMDPTALLLGARAALDPNAATQELLARTFGITSDQAKKVFPLGDPLPPDSAALTAVGGSPVDASLVTPFGPTRSPYVQGLYGRPGTAGVQVLEALRAPGTVQLDLLYVPRLGAAGELLRLPISLTITSSVDTAGKTHSYAQLSGLHLGGGVKRTDAAAVDCFLARYAASTLWVTKATAPSREYGPVYDVCAPLSPDPAGALASDERSRVIVVREFEDTARPSGAYWSWDWALIHLVDSMVTRGIGLDQLPTSVGTSSISGRTNDLADYLQAVSDAEDRKALQSTLVQLAYDQHITGRVLNTTYQQRLLWALEDASHPFRASTQRMLEDLLESDRTAGLEAIDCGASIPAGWVQSVEGTIADAQSYAYGKGFGDRLRGAVLQACYAQADLDSATAAVAAARAFTDAERARSPGISFESSHQEFVDHALDQRWTANVYSSAADATGLALASDSSFCSTYQTISEQAVCAGALSTKHPWLSAAAGGMLNPQLAERYAALARDLLPWFATKLDPLSDFDVRYPVSNAYFGEHGIWLSCASDPYAQRRNQLFAKLDEWTKTTDVATRMTIATQIDDLVSTDCASAAQ